MILCPDCHRPTESHLNHRGDYVGCPQPGPIRCMIRRWGGVRNTRGEGVRAHGWRDVGIEAGAIVAVVDQLDDAGDVRVLNLTAGGEWRMPYSMAGGRETHKVPQSTVDGVKVDVESIVGAPIVMVRTMRW